MQLDRFTEKAQEAIVNAQQLAERSQSPVLDAEHILAALVGPDDGVPAETLRRLGVDLPAFRDEVAGTLARRARKLLAAWLKKRSSASQRSAEQRLSRPWRANCLRLLSAQRLKRSR